MSAHIIQPVKASHRTMALIAMAMGLVGVYVVWRSLAGSPVDTIVHPDGTLVSRPGETVYLIDNSTLRAIPNPAVLESQGYDWPQIKPATAADMALPKGPNVGYRDGTLLSDGAGVYITDSSSGQIQKRLITSGSVFDGLGLHWTRIISVAPNQMPSAIGAPVADASVHPIGTLFDGRPGVYISRGGKRSPVSSPAALETNGYGWADVAEPTPADLAEPTTAALQIREGTTVSGPQPGVYVIDYTTSGLQKRLFASSNIFTGLGYRWEDIVSVGAAELPTANGPNVDFPKAAPSPNVASSPSPSPSSPPPRAQLPNTDEGIHLGIPFDYRLKNPTSTLSGNVDYVWGSRIPNIKGVVTDYYIPYARDGNTGSGHTLADLQQNHPDWVAYRCDKKTPVYEYGNLDHIPLDITNPDVRQYQLQTAIPYLDKGYSGIAWDNLDFVNWQGRCGVYKKGQWNQLYGGTSVDPKYLADVVNWAKTMRSMLKAKYPDAEMTGNFSISSQVGLDGFKQLAQNFDVEYDESGFTVFGGGRIGDQTWLDKVQSLEYMESIGRAFVIDGMVESNTKNPASKDDVQWVLSNYLLVKGHHSFVYVVTNGIYGDFTDRPEYHLPIGHPTSARYLSQGVQMRNFSGGLALVNSSSTRSYTIRASGYKDAYGAAVSTITLQPETGMVLLKSP